VLNRHPQGAGWTLIMTGPGDERVSVDLDAVDPREAVRQVLKQANAWGVAARQRPGCAARRDEGERKGELIESRGPPRPRRESAPGSRPRHAGRPGGPRGTWYQATRWWWAAA